MRVAYVVADVVGERPNREGELVSILGIAKEMNDEVAGADVMGQVGDEGVAERIVANVLNDAARIGVGACLFQLFCGDAGIPAAQQRHDRTLPGQVDQLFVGKERISPGRLTRAEAHTIQETEARKRLRIRSSIAELG